MRKISLLLIAFFAVSFALQAQHTPTMVKSDYKKQIDKEVITEATTLVANDAKGAITIGGSNNVYSVFITDYHQVSYNQATNSVIFGHRMLNPGGNSGIVAVDVSTDGGATWSTEVELTPGFEAGGCTGLRYPSATIFDVDGTAANAKAVVAGPGLSSVTSSWGQTYFASGSFDGTGIGEDYPTLFGDNTDWAVHGLVPAGGAVWAIVTNGAYNAFHVVKGEFNAGSADFSWSSVAELSLNAFVYSGSNGDATLGNDFDLAFNADGSVGYAVLAGCEDGANIQPVPHVWKTTDAGATWTSLGFIDWKDFVGFEELLAPDDDGSIYPWFSDIDLVVDSNDDLHIFTDLTSGAPSGGPGFGYFGLSYYVDFVTNDGVNYDFSVITPVMNTDYYEWDAANGFVYYPMYEISSTTDGTAIFYTWAETVGSEIMEEPDILSVAYDVASDNFSDTKNLTEGTDAELIAYYMQGSPIAIDGGEDFDFELPLVYTEVGADALSPTQYYYLKGAGFNASEFVLASVDDVDAPSTFSVFPNPTSELVNITNTAKANVAIYDLVGKKVMGASNCDAFTTLNVSELSEGTYILQVEKEGMTTSEKLVIMK